MSTNRCVFGAFLLSLVSYPAFPQAAPAENMSFFVTSVGPGTGGNLGGLDGADQYCQMLASRVGAGNRTWRAYLSTNASDDGQPAVNARDRIGSGPWYNFSGILIAENVERLHDGGDNLNKETALTEKGETVPVAGDGATSHHDILTGSDSSGRPYVNTGTNTLTPPAEGSGTDATCQAWTDNSRNFTARVGHSDRVGPEGDDPSSWNSAHVTLGCNQDWLLAFGGVGLFYCFAAD